MKQKYTLWEFIKSFFIVVNESQYKSRPKNLITDALGYLTLHFGDDKTKYCLSKNTNHNIFTYLDIIENMEKEQNRFLTQLEIIKIGVRNDLIYKTNNIGYMHHKKIDDLIDSMFKSKIYREYIS